MPLSSIVHFLFAGFILSQLACKCDGLVDCDENGGHAEIRLVRDGKNAVYGPDAFIVRDSIKLFSSSLHHAESVIFFIDSSESMMLYLRPNIPMILETPGRSDTLTCTTMITDRSECCETYSLASVQWNREDLCIEDCTAIMEIEY